MNPRDMVTGGNYEVLSTISIYPYTITVKDHYEDGFSATFDSLLFPGTRADGFFFYGEVLTVKELV